MQAHPVCDAARAEAGNNQPAGVAEGPAHKGGAHDECVSAHQSVDNFSAGTTVDQIRTGVVENVIAVTGCCTCAVHLRRCQIVCVGTTTLTNCAVHVSHPTNQSNDRNDSVHTCPLHDCWHCHIVHHTLAIACCICSWRRSCLVHTRRVWTRKRWQLFAVPGIVTWFTTLSLVCFCVLRVQL